MKLLSYAFQWLYQFCGGVVLPDCKVVKIDVVEAEEIVKLIEGAKLLSCPEEHIKAGVCVCMTCGNLEKCDLEKSFKKTCLAKFITNCSFKNEHYMEKKDAKEGN